MNADKYSPASSARSTKRQVRGDASVSGSLQLLLTDHEATAFMSKERSGPGMSALLIYDSNKLTGSIPANQHRSDLFVNWLFQWLRRSLFLLFHLLHQKLHGSLCNNINLLTDSCDRKD